MTCFNNFNFRRRFSLVALACLCLGIVGQLHAYIDLAPTISKIMSDAQKISVVEVAGLSGMSEACRSCVGDSRQGKAQLRRGRRLERRLGPELVWFPDPVGARECLTVAMGVQLLHDAVPAALRLRADARLHPPRIRLRRRAAANREPRVGA